MSVEYEEMVRQDQREDRKRERLRNRKNKWKHRARDLRIIKEYKNYVRGYIKRSKNGEEYLGHIDKIRDKYHMKRNTRRRVRREEDVPDGNGYRKYEESCYW